MRKAFIAIAAFALALVPAVASAQSSDGQVTVIHGIPDLAVDVYVNGGLTLEDFTFGTVTDPLTLPAADYEIEIYGADADPAAGDPALASTVTLPAGANATIIANLDGSGAPTLSVFVNDISNTDAGNGRVTARHLAAAPNVDIWAGDSPLFTDVPNGAEGVADVPAGSYPIQIVPAGATEPVVWEADVNVPEGSNVIAHAIGSLEGGSFQVAVQIISGLDSAPTGVPAGDAGLASVGSPLWLLAMVALGALMVGTAGLAVRREN
ncbi:MAG: DUF4397 domain-containing protein [Acidimicrobiia bacterium]|nr:DUF4397 domain-containing protein [Acidimicrobiia bacterium]